jgi:hypothetical protein
MTGLLSRIAARAVGEVPVAAPRTPSRFEPLAEELGLPEPEPAVGSYEAPSLERPVPGQGPHPAPVATVTPVLADLPATAHGPASISSSPIGATVMRRESPPQAAAQNPAKPSSPSHLPALADQARAAPAAPSVETETAAAAPAALAPATGPPSSAVLDVEQTRSTRRAAVDSEGPLSTEKAGAVERHRPTTDPGDASTSQPAPAESLAEPPRPTIEIHIGSIEVRAAAAPAPPAARPAPAPSSLDAFLSRGRGA